MKRVDMDNVEKKPRVRPTQKMMQELVKKHQEEIEQFTRMLKADYDRRISQISIDLDEERTALNSKVVDLVSMHSNLQQSNRDKDAEIALLKKELALQLEIKAELKKNEHLRESVNKFKEQAEAVPFWKVLRK
jgi:uncharacterized protein YfbU (UPF0304 family)